MSTSSLMAKCIEKYMCAHRWRQLSFCFEVFVRFFQFSLKVGLTLDMLCMGQYWVSRW